jgi:uncharacterized membrane protein HdeD (DUF308 family)
MEKQFDVFVAETPGALATHWFWLVALGVGLMLVGGLAIWRARTATRLYVVFLGVLLLVAAVAVFLTAFSLTGYWTAFFTHVLWAVLLGIIGFVFATRPSTTAEAITLVLAVYFIAAGVLGIGFALFSHIPAQWLSVFDGAVSIALGALLLSGWPVSGLWAIGLFIGIDLILRGAAIAALGLSLQPLTR